ncbi:hypothetical protein BGAL_0013g00130 [Botrytis galanthina]|uniref:Uncharacterized protein n=1 Tax=Botrytis galanthina TaxID=278940 RepID=A0A4S8RAQ3_9HELO|nr:hypothetical protein BGAL_0013g00130 [Botrytis galanthina]
MAKSPGFEEISILAIIMHQKLTNSWKLTFGEVNATPPSAQRPYGQMKLFPVGERYESVNGEPDSSSYVH